MVCRARDATRTTQGLERPRMIAFTNNACISAAEPRTAPQQISSDAQCSGESIEPVEDSSSESGAANDAPAVELVFTLQCHCSSLDLTLDLRVC